MLVYNLESLKMFGHVVQVLGPVWSARLISLTTIFIETFADMFAFGRKLGHSTVHWLGGSSRTWVFMRENVGPLPSCAVKDYITNSNVTWRFDLSDTTLNYVDENYESNENEVIDIRHLPWLSAKIVFSGGGEHDIDTFCSNFVFIAPRNVKPTPKLILSCWSVLSGIWLLPGQDARFVIINQDGEEETFFIHSRPSTEVDRWSDIFEINDEEEEASESSENESDSEDSSEDSTEGGEEDDAATETVSQGGEDADDEGTDSEKLDGLNISEHSVDSGDSAAASDESHTPPEVIEEPKVDE